MLGKVELQVEINEKESKIKPNVKDKFETKETNQIQRMFSLFVIKFWYGNWQNSFLDYSRIQAQKDSTCIITFNVSFVFNTSSIAISTLSSCLL